VLLVFCSINGFLASSYFTLMLLDIVTISPTVQSLVKSVTKPGAQLAIVAYLFVIMVIIYASFGLDYFEDGFTFDADYEDDADDEVGPNPRGCHSVVSCFWLIM
jgi:membrane-anchored glycerophosphoryl diester phosphodiesterase (GDPDase)